MFRNGMTVNTNATEVGFIGLDMMGKSMADLLE